MSSQNSPQRAVERRYISESENIYLNFSIGHFNLNGHLIDSTIGGIGAKVCCSFEQFSELEKMVSHEFTINIQPSGLESFQTKAQLIRVNDLSKSKDKTVARCGFRICFNDNGTGKNRRSFKFNSKLQPTFTFENSIFYYELIFGQVVSCNYNSIICSTSISNKNILPGMAIRLQVDIPLQGHIKCDAIVRSYSLDPNDKERGLIDLVIKTQIQNYQSKIGTLILLNEKNESPLSLKREGFRISSYIKGVSLEYGKLDEIQNDLGFLRWIAWKDKDPTFQNLSPSDMFDSFDKYSRHLIAKINGKLVASARLVYNNGLKERCEHLSYRAEIPEWLWDSGFVETSRLVTHPDFRGSDLFMSMTRFIGRTVTQSGYRYMISSCESSLEKIYIDSGCKKLNSFLDENNIPWSLLVMDLKETGMTKDMNPIVWNIVHAPNTKYMIERGYFNPTLFEKFRINLYYLFKPLAHWLFNKKTSKTK